MKWIVNGDEHEFLPTDVEIRQEEDLYWIKTSDGWRSAALLRKGAKVWISYRGRQYTLEPPRTARAGTASPSSGNIVAPMPGLIVAVLVEVGETVTKNQVLVVLEAMKTQISLSAPFDGTVQELNVSVSQQVKSNELLAILR